MKKGHNALARAENSGRIYGSLQLEDLAQENQNTLRKTASQFGFMGYDEWWSSGSASKNFTEMHIFIASRAGISASHLTMVYLL